MSLKLLRSLRIRILSDLGFIIGMYFDLEWGCFLRGRILSEAGGEDWEDGFLPVGEVSGHYVLTGLCDEPEVECEVMD